MPTKLADSPIPRPRSGTADAPPAPSIPDTLAYWLEDETGTRVTKLYRLATTPLVFAGRALENRGNLQGWSLVRRDTNGIRHVVATASEFANLAEPFMPERTPLEAEQIRRHLDTIRAIGFRRSNAVTDERVY